MNVEGGLGVKTVELGNGEGGKGEGVVVRGEKGRGSEGSVFGVGDGLRGCGFGRWL